MARHAFLTTVALALGSSPALADLASTGATSPALNSTGDATISSLTIGDGTLPGTVGITTGSTLTVESQTRIDQGELAISGLQSTLQTESLLVGTEPGGEASLQLTGYGRVLTGSLTAGATGATPGSAMLLLDTGSSLQVEESLQILGGTELTIAGGSILQWGTPAWGSIVYGLVVSLGESGSTMNGHTLLQEQSAIIDQGGVVSVGGSGSMMNGHTLIVGQTGTGTLHVGPFEPYVYMESLVLGEQAGSHGILELAGGIVNEGYEPGRMTVGLHGTGEIRVLEGSYFRGSWTLGAGAGGLGILDIAGTGAPLGDGDFESPRAALSFLELGGVEGSSGELRLHDAASAGIDTLVFGPGGGQVTVSDGSHLALGDSFHHSDTLIIDNEGSLQVMGADSQLFVSADLIIGESGAGALHLGEGSRFELQGNLLLGSLPGSQGLLSLTGGDIVFEHYQYYPGEPYFYYGGEDGPVVVGAEGSGEIQLLENAGLDGGSSWHRPMLLGAGAGGHGTLLLTGTGAPPAPDRLPVSIGLLGLGSFNGGHGVLALAQAAGGRFGEIHTEQGGTSEVELADQSHLWADSFLVQGDSRLRLASNSTTEIVMLTIAGQGRLAVSTESSVLNSENLLIQLGGELALQNAQVETARLRVDDALIGGQGTLLASIFESRGALNLQPGGAGDIGLLELETDAFALDAAAAHRFEFDIAGAGVDLFDRLMLSAALEADDLTLVFHFIEGYLPVGGSAWEFLFADDFIGFDDYMIEISGPPQLQADRFSLQRNAGSLSLVMSPVPLPAAFWLLAGAIGLLLPARRTGSRGFFK